MEQVTSMKKPLFLRAADRKQSKRRTQYRYRTTEHVQNRKHKRDEDGFFKDALVERLNRPCNNRVLFLGEIGRRKGCFDIPAIVEKVIEVIPDAKFILCGAGTEADLWAIKSALKNKNIDRNVEFPGWVRDAEKDKVLRDADVFLLPSYNEGMPMSILDAMG